MHQFAISNDRDDESKRNAINFNFVAFIVYIAFSSLGLQVVRSRSEKKKQLALFNSDIAL